MAHTADVLYMSVGELTETVLGAVIQARNEFNNDLSDEALTAVVLSDLGYI